MDIFYYTFFHADTYSTLRSITHAHRYQEALDLLRRALEIYEANFNFGVNVGRERERVSENESERERTFSSSSSSSLSSSYFSSSSSMSVSLQHHPFVKRVLLLVDEINLAVYISHVRSYVDSLKRTIYSWIWR